MKVENKQLIKDLIEAAGGLAVVCHDLNLHPLTVMRWADKGRIPKKNLSRLKKMAPNFNWDQASSIFD